MEDFGTRVVKYIGDRAKRTILDPVNRQLDEQFTDISTSIGAFLIRHFRGKWQRMITFTVRSTEPNIWMEEAIMGIIYEYNNIKKRSALEIQESRWSDNKNVSLVYVLPDGTHNLRYRKWDILLNVATKMISNNIGRTAYVRTYTVICYDLNPAFVKYFEADMIRHRNSILEIKKDSPFVNVYRDICDAQYGTIYWDKVHSIPKRGLNTIYIPHEQKDLLVSTIDGWFQAKKQYRKHGIPWNLKILLYGPNGVGKSSIVKMIASHWNRNIYECTGGRLGKMIPQCITDDSAIVVSPLFSISDADKYPYLVNESDIDVSKTDTKDEAVAAKQTFNDMINALDGILSGDGKIIVLTTNHIEKFSETLLRPGRMDLIMKIGYVTEEVFRDYVKDFYKVDLPENIKLKRDDLTVAMMQADVLFYKLPAKDFIDKYCEVK